MVANELLDDPFLVVVWVFLVDPADFLWAPFVVADERVFTLALVLLFDGYLLAVLALRLACVFWVPCLLFVVALVVLFAPIASSRLDKMPSFLEVFAFLVLAVRPWAVDRAELWVLFVALLAPPLLEVDCDLSFVHSLPLHT